MTALDRLDDLLFTPPTLEEQVRWMRERYPEAFTPVRPNPLPSLTSYLAANGGLMGGLIQGHDTVMSWTRGMRGVQAPVRRKT